MTGPSTGESIKELSSDAKGPLRCSKKFRSVHVCEETIWGHLMNHPRELKRSLPFTFKPGIVAIPTKQSENLCDTQSTGQRTRQNFTSVMGEISPRLSENPPNTTLNQDLNRWNWIQKCNGVPGQSTRLFAARETYTVSTRWESESLRAHGSFPSVQRSKKIRRVLRKKSITTNPQITQW